MMPGPSRWHDDIDNTERLAFFRLLTTVEMLHISGKLEGQVTRALEDVPQEMVTEVLPSLRSLMLLDVDSDGPVECAGQFVSLHQLYGRPVTIRDTRHESGPIEAYNGCQEKVSAPASCILQQI